MAKVKVGTLAIDVTTKADAFHQGMNNIDKRLKTFGKSMQNIGRDLTKFVTIPLLAVGTGAVAAANTVDEAMDTIRAGTGATGKDLEALGESFKTVFGNVPQTAEQVGTAIADLNTRLGLAGKPLEEMATQVLNLSRITKTDLESLIPSMTRMFGDWSIATANQADAMDRVFKTSQQTGVSVDQLGQLIVQYGAPLRQLGFDFDTASAMIAKFQKEGVNTELVMGSLRIALGKMSKEGVKDPVEALGILIDRIKEAGSAGEANAIAFENFGARAGADMAAAIREGRFELDSLLASIEKSPDTINQAARDTMSFGESMAELRNKVTLALQPLGVELLEVFDKLKPSIEMIIARVAEMIEKFANMPEGTQKLVLALAAVAAAAGPAASAIGGISNAVSSTGGLVKMLSGSLGKLGVTAGGGAIAGIAAGIAALGASTYIAYQKNEQFRESVQTVWGFLKGIFDVVGPLIKTSFEAASGFVQDFISIIANAVKVISSLIRGDWAGAWEAAKDLFMVPIETIKRAMSTFFTLIDQLFGGIAGKIGGSTKAAYDAAKTWLVDSFQTVVDKVKGFAGSIIAAFAGLPAKVIQAFKDMYNGIKTWFVDKLNSLLDPIKKFSSSVGGFFKGLYDAVVGHSYVPDLVEGIGKEFDKLGAVMVKPAQDAAEATKEAFAGIPAKVETKLNISVLESAAPKFSQLIKSIAAMATGNFSGVIQFLTEHSEALGEVFGMLEEGVVALLAPIDALIGVLKKFLGSAGMGALAGGGIGFLLGGPIGALVGAITGAIGGLAAQWKNFLEKADLNSLFAKMTDLKAQQATWAKYPLGSLLAKNLQKKIDEIIGQVKTNLKITIGDLADDVRSAFSAKTIEEFTSNLKQSVYSKVKDALIQAWMASSAVTPLFSQLSNAIFNAIQDGVMTTAEVGGIKSIVGLIGEAAGTFYSSLKELGLDFEELGSTASSVSESLSNVPEGFKIALARFNAIDVPSMATGGYVSPRAGGTLVRLGEGGEGEFVTPASRMGGGITVNITSNDPAYIWRKIKPLIERENVRGGGSIVNQAPAYVGG